MKVFDFMCEPCNVIFDELVENDERFLPCPECTQPAERIISAPLIGKMNDPATRAATLRKRSHDHTMKNLSKEPEKYGFQKDVHRRWNIRGRK